MWQIRKDYQPNKFKRFFLELIARMDKKLEEKSKSACCSKPAHKGDKSCCS